MVCLKTHRSFVSKFLNVTKVIGGARIYQRKEGGSWQYDFFVDGGQGRIRQSLKTTDKAFATREAERLTLEAKSAVAAGVRVKAGTLGECVDAYVLHQQDRLRRGEIRSADNVRYKTSFVRRTLSHLFGLDRSIAALTQKDWDLFIPWRLDECQAELETVRQECSLIRSFCRFSRQYGCYFIPELIVKVPKSKRSRRTETFTSDEFLDLVGALEEFIQPDQGDVYLRDWGLGAAKARQKKPKIVHQDLERSRREMLRFFVLVAASSGCRPHEIAGDRRGSLRWRDVVFKDVLVQVSMSHREPTPKTVAILKVRELTKTGERSVPMAGGKYLKQVKAWSRFTNPDDYVFCDQYGIRAGMPPYMDSLRLQWRELMRRMQFTRFKPDLYSLRHFFATQRLQSGAPPYLIAKALGHSITELTTVYSHVLMENEGVIRHVWQENTPEPLLKMGVVISDPSWEML